MGLPIICSSCPLLQGDHLDIDGTVLLLFGELDGTSILAQELNGEASKVGLGVRGGSSELFDDGLPVFFLPQDALRTVLGILDHHLKEFLCYFIVLAALAIDHREHYDV
jgi:hypothetical protein